MNVLEYCKDNLPLFVPLLILTILFVAFTIFLFCRQFKKSIVKSAASALYNATSPGVANQSSSTNRTSRNSKQLRRTSGGSEHGLEMVTTSPRNNNRNRNNFIFSPSRLPRRSNRRDANGDSIISFDFNSSDTDYNYPSDKRRPLGSMLDDMMSSNEDIHPKRNKRSTTGSSHRSHSKYSSGYANNRNQLPYEGSNSRFMGFQDDYRGNYPGCLMDSMLPVGIQGFPNDHRNSQAIPKRHRHNAWRERRENSVNHCCNQLMPEVRISSSSRAPSQINSVHNRAYSDFHLTPVMEEVGGGTSTMGSMTRPQGGQGQTATTSVNANGPMWFTCNQKPRHGSVGSLRNFDPEELHSNYPTFHRYSTPLPPAVKHHLQMTRTASKTSSGMVSATTNQSARTCYTNHNDLAHSISSISLSSDYCFPEEYSDILDINRPTCAPRPYSSDSELDICMPPGSRSSLSKALNLNPIPVPFHPNNQLPNDCAPICTNQIPASSNQSSYKGTNHSMVLKTFQPNKSRSSSVSSGNINDGNRLLKSIWNPGSGNVIKAEVSGNNDYANVNGNVESAVNRSVENLNTEDEQQQWV